MTRKSRQVTNIIRARPLNINPDYKTADTFNEEGARAWTKPLLEQFNQFLFTNTLENTFYVSQRKLVQEAEELCKTAMVGIPSETIAEMIVNARNEGFMREAPIFALVHFSMVDIHKFKEIFNTVIRTGSDMVKFLDYTRASRGLGRGIKKAIHNWLQEKTSEFYALKYRKALYDAINLSRPSASNLFPDDPYKREILDWIKTGDVLHPEVLPQITAYNKLKEADTLTIEEFTELQQTARLNQELITSTTKMTPEVWIEASKWMGTFAFLRHLATFERNGILDSEVILAGLKARINSEILRRAKIFPFRLIDAHRMINDFATKQYLSDVLDLYVPLYDFSHYGATGIFPDVSGSMGPGFFSSKVPKGYRSYDQISGYMAGMLHKGIKNSVLVPWGRTYFKPIHSKRSVMEIADLCSHRNTGTYMEAPIEYLINEKKILDTVILITDTEEWGHGFLTKWKEYKQIAPEARAFLIRIDPYRTNPFPQDQAGALNIHQIYGWNDSVFKYIDYVLKYSGE